MAKKTYVLDTSVCLTDAKCLQKYQNNDIVIPLKVLEEIDKHKKRQDSVGANARKIIRTFDSLRARGNLQKGVRMGRGKGLLRVNYGDASLLPGDLSTDIADNLIISTALSELKNTPIRKVILVSRDINMRVICDSVGVQSEGYALDKVIENHSSLYDGFVTKLVDDQIIDQFYEGGDIYLENDKGMNPNQFVMLVSSSNEKKTALARYIARGNPLKEIYHVGGKGLWGVSPRNKEQAFALDLLLDPEIPFVSLVGKAGSGKTLLAIAAGISQVLRDPFAKNVPIYKKLVVSRPVQPMGKDIGFLPGSMEEKMRPWLMPIQDNLQYLMGDDKITLEEYMGQGIIELEALTYIRGRSISNAFIVIDEAQNLSMHEIKTIMTRVGEGTKLVLTGDIEQIDNVYVDETSSGLVHAVEKFKRTSLTGHITLKKGERSRLATLAAEIL
ncbi:MAG: PhoH family protein [Rhodobacteraceae bacterium]|nr:PhoH family protein [Paracoccaceae bacterium]